MLTFRSYLSDRNRLISIGELATELARKTEDPESFVLEFVEARYPRLYGPLLESIYLEDGADPRPPTSGGGAPAGGAEAAGGGEGDGDAPGARPAKKVQHKTFLGWLNDLFSGGGAAKNFDKAVKAISRVDSVVKTIHIPPNFQQEGGPAAGYDNFRDELEEVLKKMQELGQQSQLLHVADAIKRDPNYVQELEQELGPVRAADEAESGGEEGSPEEPASGGDIEKVTPGNSAKTELNRHKFGKRAFDAILRLTAWDADFKAKTLPPSGWREGMPVPDDSEYIPGYATALSLITVKLFEKEHPDHGDDEAVFDDWWSRNKTGILRKAAAYVNIPARAPKTPAADGSEHGGGSTPVDGYHPSHTVHKGNMFAEALVLAGVPQKKRKTR